MYIKLIEINLYVLLQFCQNRFCCHAAIYYNKINIYFTQAKTIQAIETAVLIAKTEGKRYDGLMQRSMN